MKNLLLSMLFSIIGSLCVGQITVQVMQNPSPDISKWENRENMVTVTVNNRGPETEARFSSKLKLDGRTKAFTNVDQMPLITIERGVNRFAIDEVMPYRAIEVADVKASSMARSGQLPAGNYELCVALVDVSNKPLHDFQEACAFFMLTQIQLPILISPLADQLIPQKTRPTFSWTPATPVSTGTRITYKLQVFEVLDGQGMMQALQGNRPIISEEVEGLTQFWPTEWDMPENINTFVWTVQVLDESGNPLGDNNGIASPQMFKIDQGGNGGNKIADGEPWIQCLGKVCRIKGVKLEIYVPFDAVTTGSTTYKITAWSINISYYATAAQVLAEFGTTGASEVSDWVGYVSAGAGYSYCDKDGYPIVDQIVYEVTKPNPNNYNGNTNELHASGACFDYGTYTALANHYNSYNNSYADVPTSCVEGCVGGGGIDNGGSGGGGTNVNAAGQEIDDITLDPVGGDGGGISPGGGGLVGHDEAPVDIANPNIIWVAKPGQGFKPYFGEKDELSNKVYCKCSDGSYCVSDKKCECCPKELKESVKAQLCSCEVEGHKVSILTTEDCSKTCQRFQTTHSKNATKKKKR